MAAAADGDPVRRLAGRIVDHLDHADEGGRAVEHGRGALEHLDPLDVVEVEVRNGRVERAAERHAVDHQQKGVELVQPPERRNGAGRAGVAAGGRFDARRQWPGRPQIGHAAGAQVVAGEDGDVVGTLSAGSGIRVAVTSTGRFSGGDPRSPRRPPGDQERAEDKAVS